MSQLVVPIPQQSMLCSKTKGCGNEGLVCAGSGCVKVICRNCYEVAVLTKNKIKLEDALPDELAVCTVRCHKKATKAGINNAILLPSSCDNGGTTGDQRIPWDNDTETGEYDGSSEAMLLDWLKIPGNFAHWKGNERGISKREIQMELAEMLNREGQRMHIIARDRDKKQVGAKIRYVCRKFQDT